MKPAEVAVGRMVCDLDHTRMPMTVRVVSHNGRAVICDWYDGHVMRQSMFDVGTLLPWSGRLWRWGSKE